MELKSSSFLVLQQEYGFSPTEIESFPRSALLAYLAALDGEALSERVVLSHFSPLTPGDDEVSMALGGEDWEIGEVLLPLSDVLSVVCLEVVENPRSRQFFENCFSAPGIKPSDFRGRRMVLVATDSAVLSEQVEFEVFFLSDGYDEAEAYQEDPEMFLEPCQSDLAELMLDSQFYQVGEKPFVLPVSFFGYQAGDRVPTLTVGRRDCRHSLLSLSNYQKGRLVEAILDTLETEALMDFTDADESDLEIVREEFEGTRNILTASPQSTVFVLRPPNSTPLGGERFCSLPDFSAIGFNGTYLSSMGDTDIPEDSYYQSLVEAENTFFGDSSKASSKSLRSAF